eukprot:5075509-Pleurochrysis_carterae.AAC.1
MAREGRPLPALRRTSLASRLPASQARRGTTRQVGRQRCACYGRRRIERVGRCHRRSAVLKWRGRTLG